MTDLCGIMPVFIGGCERSGTTLLGSMLGTHPGVVTVPESQFKVEVLHRCTSREGVLDVALALGLIRRQWRFWLWDILLDPADISSLEAAPSYAELLGLLVRKYGARHGRLEPKMWVDHTPSNLKHAVVLTEVFPDARFIHIVRDGRGVAASVMKLDWGPNTVAVAAHWWAEMVSCGLAAELFFGAQRVLRIRYEDLVLDADSTLRTVCSFLGLKYSPQMVGGSGFEVPRYTLKQHALIGRPPSVARCTAWKVEMTDREIEIFEYVSGDLLRLLGYDQRYGARARPMTRQEKLVLAIRELYRGQIVNRYRQRKRQRRLVPICT